MPAILHLLVRFVADIFKSRRRLEAENLFLRHQLNIALRRAAPRLRLRGGDRALLVWMVRLWPSQLGVAKVVQPETILRWHRSGFQAFWRWKSRNRAGRPKVDRELRDLIRRMSGESSLWGAPRIHGELLMLGFEIVQSTVFKYMVRGPRPPLTVLLDESPYGCCTLPGYEDLETTYPHVMARPLRQSFRRLCRVFFDPRELLFFCTQCSGNRHDQQYPADRLRKFGRSVDRTIAPSDPSVATMMFHIR